MSGINMVDFTIFGLLLVSGFIGVARGFTREVLGVAAWAGALFTALYGMVLVRPFVTKYIHTPFIADTVSGLLIFIIALFIFGTISRSLSQRVKGSVLGGLDRSLGLVFGVARGAFLVIIAFSVTTLIYSNMDKWPAEIKEAKMYPLVNDGSLWLKSMVPQDALKNLGLHEKTEETATLSTSMDHVVTALSQPKAAGFTAPEQKPEGYKENQSEDLDRLVKNNE